MQLLALADTQLGRCEQRRRELAQDSQILVRMQAQWMIEDRSNLGVGVFGIEIILQEGR